MELPEVYVFSAFTSFPPVAIPKSIDMQEVFDSSASTSLPPVATTLPASFLPDAITSPTHSTPDPPLQDVIMVSILILPMLVPRQTQSSLMRLILLMLLPRQTQSYARILKDGIANICLKYQLPATMVGNVFTLIPNKQGHFESTGIIMLGLLSLALLAFITGKLMRYERPLIAAVAELVGISLCTTSLIYPMSVFFRGSILSYVPLIFGVVIAGMYIYRLATTSGGGDTNGAPVQVGNEERV